MRRLALCVTSTEPVAIYGSVTNIMSFPSGGDNVPDLDPAKVTEALEETGDEQLTQQLLQHDAGDGEENEREVPALENTSQEVVEEEEGDEEDVSDREEDVSDREEDVSDREEESGDEEEPETEQEAAEELKVEELSEAKEGPKYEIEVDEIQPEVEVVEGEEVEEYEYTKEEIKYMKTAFVAYQIEKPQSKQSPRRQDKKKEAKTTEIPIGTLGSVLRSLGLNPTQQALRRYAEWLDADAKKGLVKFEEFLIIVGQEKKVIIDESHVLEAFRFIDVENERVISVQNLQALLVNTCERFTPEEWVIFVHLADPKKTGNVNYENFVERMGPNPPPPEKKKKRKGKKKKKR